MKILIIEDTPRHLEDAVRIITAAGHEVITATNWADAERSLIEWGDISSNKPVAEMIGGVISDLHYPIYEDDPETKGYPNGLLTLASCKEMNIQCVICIAGYHHGDKYDWAHRMVRAMKGVMVDSYIGPDKNKEMETKRWKDALEVLIHLKERND